MRRGESFFKFTKWLMLLTGTWRVELVGVSKTWRISYKVYSVLIQIAYYTSPVSITISFFELWGVDNGKAVECLSMLVFMVLLAAKISLCQTKEMAEVLTNAIEDVNTSILINDMYTKKVFSNHLRFTTVINMFITMYSFGMGATVIVTNCMDYYQLKQRYLNTGEIFQKPVHILYWYPFDVNDNYGFVLFYQFAAVLLSDLYNSAIEALYNTVLIQLSVQLKVLQHHLKHFTKDLTTGCDISQCKALHNIKVLVEKHQKIIKYVKDLNATLKYLVLIEYVASSLMLAAVVVQILSGKRFFFNLTYLLLLVFQWFLLSWNANEICVQSQQLSYALYESRWFEQNKETNQILFIMMLRCGKCLTLDIGPFGPLTIDAAISRLKLAYSYVSLISGNSRGNSR